MIEESTTLREMAFIVCTAFDEADVTVILIGSTVARIQAPAAFTTSDQDSILMFGAPGDSPPNAVMEQLGFSRGTAGEFRHPNSSFIVEFHAWPISIGEELVQSWETWEEDNWVLHILSATDYVKDTLASYIFEKDFASLDKALAVATRTWIDLGAVKVWCDREGKPEKFKAFLSRLSISN